jgi:hypothetical protein
MTTPTSLETGMDVTLVLDDLSGIAPTAFVTSSSVGVPVTYVPTEPASSVSSTFFAFHMAYGGAAIFNKNTSTWTTYPATVDDDGSCIYNGTRYGAPTAGSRGAVLNQAVDAFNLLPNADLWISPGTFDTGGALWANPRNIYLDLSNGSTSLSGNAGTSSNSVYGAGSNSTQLLFTCDGSTWGTFAVIRLGANGSVIAGLKITGYYDRPDQFIEGREFQLGDTGSANMFLYDLYLDPVPWMLPDTTVLKDGYQTGAVVWTHAGLSDHPIYTIESGHGTVGALSGNIVNCTLYGNYGILVLDGGCPLGQSVNVYNSSLNFRHTSIAGGGGAITANYLVGGLPGRVNFYNCIIDGGAVALIAVDNQSPCTTSLYNGTTIQNMAAGATASITNASGTLNVAPSVVYPNSSGVLTPVADVVPTVPSFPVLSYPTPVFTT